MPSSQFREIAFYTQLNIEEYKERLVKNTAPEKGFFSYLNPKPLACRIDGYDFQMRKNFEGSNSWRVIFYGSLISQKQGTSIEGQFKTSIPIESAMLVGIGIVIAFGVLGTSVTIFDLLTT